MRLRFDQVGHAPTFVLGVLACICIRWARKIDDAHEVE